MGECNDSFVSLCPSSGIIMEKRIEKMKKLEDRMECCVAIASKLKHSLLEDARGMVGL